MSKCPYCGWECVEIVGRPYSGLGRGRCPNCQSNGPEVSPPSAAIDTFCNPTYLLNKTGLIRLAAANGYVKLGDDEIVVKRGTLNALIDDHCADCTFDSLEIHDCDNCDLKPIRDRLKSEEGK